MAARTWPVRAFMRANVGPGRPLPFAQHHSPYREAAVPSTSSFVRSFAVSAVDSRMNSGSAPSTLHRQFVRVPNTTRSTIIGGVTTRLMSSSSSAAPQYFEGPWYEKYLLLEEYKKEHGNCLVPQGFVHDDGVHLGTWVATQRKLYKKGNLSQNRREMLDALGFSWDPKADQWERNFALLEQFKEREGHCDVPIRHVEDGIRLGAWLSQQRHALKRGKLDQSYEQRLEQLGVSWDPHGDHWEGNFSLLEQYEKREGHCNVPIRHVEDGIRLGRWLNRQRKALKEGKLDQLYQRRLDELGISWDPNGDEWERNFALLKQFKGREGHCNVPISHEEDGTKLGKWLDRQRQVRKGNLGGNLGVDRIARLDGIGIRWLLYMKRKCKP